MAELVKIKMKRTQWGSSDGIGTVQYDKDGEFMVSRELADVFLKENACTEEKGEPLPATPLVAAGPAYGGPPVAPPVMQVAAQPPEAKAPRPLRGQNAPGDRSLTANTDKK